MARMAQRRVKVTIEFRQMANTNDISKRSITTITSIILRHMLAMMGCMGLRRRRWVLCQVAARAIGQPGSSSDRRIRVRVRVSGREVAAEMVAAVVAWMLLQHQVQLVADVMGAVVGEAGAVVVVVGGSRSRHTMLWLWVQLLTPRWMRLPLSLLLMWTMVVVMKMARTPPA